MKYINRVSEDKFKKALKTNKVIIVLGARQVGKTTLVEHILKGKNTNFVNLDINAQKNQFLASSKLDPNKSVGYLGSPNYLVIDEAQRLKETGTIVKGLFDSKVKCKIILLGSSSLNLLSNTAESLTGRNIKIYITPLTIEEILKNRSWFDKNILETLKEQTDVVLMETITYGSYPEVQIVENKQEYLFYLVSDYLFKDILSLGIIRNEDVLYSLLSLLARQTGQLVSINKLSNILNISRQTVEKYLDLLKKTFVLFELKPYSTNLRNEIKKSSKYYFWDVGIRNAVINELDINPLRPDIGGLFENFVVAEFAKLNALNSHFNQLYFWRDKKGREIDLVLKQESKIHAFEIGYNKRKIKGKKAFLKKYNTADIKLVNKDNYLDFLVK